MIDYETVETTKRRFCNIDGLLRKGKVCQVPCYDFDLAWKFKLYFLKSGLVPANNNQVMLLRMRKDVFRNGQTQSCGRVSAVGKSYRGADLPFDAPVSRTVLGAILPTSSLPVTSDVAYNAKLDWSIQE